MMGETMKFLYNSTKKTFKKPVQFEKQCPKCGGNGKVYSENHKLTFHCYSCGYVKFWDQVSAELKEQNENEIEYSPDYPYGGSVEPYDIERDNKLI